MLSSLLLAFCVCDLFEMCLKIFLKISRVCPREYFENSFERKYLMLFEGFEKYLMFVLENILEFLKS